jgi:hypothetical protein
VNSLSYLRIDLLKFVSFTFFAIFLFNIFFILPDVHEQGILNTYKESDVPDFVFLYSSHPTNNQQFETSQFLLNQSDSINSMLNKFLDPRSDLHYFRNSFSFIDFEILTNSIVEPSDVMKNQSVLDLIVFNDNKFNNAVNELTNNKNSEKNYTSIYIYNSQFPKLLKSNSVNIFGENGTYTLDIDIMHSISYPENPGSYDNSKLKFLPLLVGLNNDRSRSSVIISETHFLSILSNLQSIQVTNIQIEIHSYLDFVDFIDLNYIKQYDQFQSGVPYFSQYFLYFISQVPPNAPFDETKTKMFYIDGYSFVYSKIEPLLSIEPILYLIGLIIWLFSIIISVSIMVFSLNNLLRKSRLTEFFNELLIEGADHKQIRFERYFIIVGGLFLSSVLSIIGIFLLKFNFRSTNGLNFFEIFLTLFYPQSLFMVYEIFTNNDIEKDMFELQDQNIQNQKGKSFFSVFIIILLFLGVFFGLSLEFSFKSYLEFNTTIVLNVIFSFLILFELYLLLTKFNVNFIGILELVEKIFKKTRPKKTFIYFLLSMKRLMRSKKSFSSFNFWILFLIFLNFFILDFQHSQLIFEEIGSDIKVEKYLSDKDSMNVIYNNITNSINNSNIVISPFMYFTARSLIRDPNKSFDESIIDIKLVNFIGLNFSTLSYYQNFLPFTYKNITNLDEHKILISEDSIIESNQNKITIVTEKEKSFSNEGLNLSIAGSFAYAPIISSSVNKYSPSIIIDVNYLWNLIQLQNVTIGDYISSGFLIYIKGNDTTNFINTIGKLFNADYKLQVNPDISKTLLNTHQSQFQTLSFFVYFINIIFVILMVSLFIFNLNIIVTDSLPILEFFYSNEKKKKNSFYYLILINFFYLFFNTILSIVLGISFVNVVFFFLNLLDKKIINFVNYSFSIDFTLVIIIIFLQIAVLMFVTKYLFDNHLTGRKN